MENRCSVRCPAQARGYPRTMLPVPSPCMHSPARGEERRPGAGGSAARPDSEPRTRRRRPVRGDRQRCDGEPVRRPPFSGCARHGATGRPWQRRHRLVAGQCELHVWARRKAPRWPGATRVGPGCSETRRNGRATARGRSRSPDGVGDGGGRYFNCRPPPVPCLAPFSDPNRDEKF